MRKFVVYGSAFVMLISVIAMAVGFSAAWFANVTESSSPIIINSSKDTAYVVITPSNCTGILAPATYKKGYLMSSGYDSTLAMPIASDTVASLSDRPLINDNAGYEYAATIATYDGTYMFDGQEDSSGKGFRNITISLEGVYLEDPSAYVNDQTKPLSTNYIDYFTCKIGYGATSIDTTETANSVIAKTKIKENYKYEFTFNINKPDEKVPSEIMTNEIYMLIKIAA